MHQITIEEAEARIASVLDEVIHGEEIIITDHEKPVARVVPINGKHERRGFVGSAPDLIKYIADDFDETPEEFKDYI